MPTSPNGLHHGNETHYLDHIGSLCALLGFPLFVSDRDIEEKARLYYPDLITYCVPSERFAFEFFEQTDIVISCIHQFLLQRFLFLPMELSPKKWVSVWCPHGNSEKGFDEAFAKLLSEETIILCYGDKVEDHLNSKIKEDSTLPYIVRVGNYRLFYYQKMKPYYDKLLKKGLFNRLNSSFPTIFYAPSWHPHDTLQTIKDRLFFGS